MADSDNQLEPDELDLNDWQGFQEKELEAEDLVLLSRILVKHQYSMNTILTCLAIGNSNDQSFDTRVHDVKSLDTHVQRSVHKLLNDWLTSKQTVKWKTLLSCFQSLENSQSLLDSIHTSELFKGTHDQETKQNHGVLNSDQAIKFNSSSCDFLHFLFTKPVLLPLNYSDHEEHCVLQQSDVNPVLRQSFVFYTKLIKSMSISENVWKVEGVLNVTDLARLKLVKKNMKKLQIRFASLLRKAYVALHSQHEQGVSVFVASLCADKRSSIPLFEAKAVALISESTLEETFLLLTEMGAWDFINYDILESVISEFKLEELSKSLAEHEKSIAEFMSKTVLADYFKVWDGCRKIESMTDRVPVIAKIRDEWGTYTLANVASMERNLASGFHLKAIVLQLEKAISGSLYILWSVPKSIAAHMQRMMESSNRPQFAQYGIEELLIGQKINKICRNNNLYEEMYEESIQYPEIFWQKMTQLVKWMKPSVSVNSSAVNTHSIKWFKGGQLNVSENCLDRHVLNLKDAVAIISVNSSCIEHYITYRELLTMTCQVANVLKCKGVSKGDCVAIYMPAIPLAVASMLACTRIGAVHCVIFPAYRQKVLKKRLSDVKAKVIITVNERNDYHPLSEVDAVLNDSSSSDGKPTTVLVVQTSTESLTTRCTYSLLEEEMKLQPTECPPEPMDSEDLLCAVYSSGTGVDDLHLKPLYFTQAGYLVYNTLAHKYIFNCTSTDIFCCLAGLGWLAGQNSVVYGPLANGGTTILFDGCPYEEQCLKMIDDLRVTHLYTVPDVYKHWSALDESVLTKYKLSSLKVIASAGDIIPPNVEEWCVKKLGKGRCSFIDTYGQTELGGTVLIRAKESSPIHFPKTKSGMFPFFGVTPRTRESKDKKISENSMYDLCIDNVTNVPCIARNVFDIHPKSFEGNTYSTQDLVKGVELKQEDKASFFIEAESEGVGIPYWISGRSNDLIELNSKYWGINYVESHLTSTVNDRIKMSDSASKIPKLNTVIVLPPTPQPAATEPRKHLNVWVAMAFEYTGQKLEDTVSKELVSAVESGLRELFHANKDNLPPLQFIFTDCILKTLSGKRMNSVLASLSEILFVSESVRSLKKTVVVLSNTLDSYLKAETLQATCKEIKETFSSVKYTDNMILEHVGTGKICHR